MSEVRASLDRMSRFGIEPNRELGQNFLVDDNILDVIGRTAELTSEDVVLEIGGGLGVLSSYLAARVNHLHVVETDAKLEPVLRDALAEHPNSDLLVADVMGADLSGIDPAPRKIVANLPYGVAVPAILKTIEELRAAELWCVMVQREVADRLAAAPGSKTYGIPSVLVQLACEVRFVRPISRNVFRPAPNVDSALVLLRRIAAAPADEVKRVVHQAFAHRRKKLTRSVQLAGGPSRNVVESTLADIELPTSVRAEQLTPQEFARLAERLPA